ncbi:DUF4850 domain-containing protein [Alicyclobacillus fodiniaquatilis]|uniref:DUF4850 domain-containing protein n=1 Tax=Alicyclobacillus fodiniaquatilis TaxID=1661150 RepID=A0ABW4JFV6_9BACL
MWNYQYRLFAATASFTLIFGALGPTANASSSASVRVAGKYGVFELPVVGVKAQYYVSYGQKPSITPTAPLPTIHANLTPAEAKHFEIYWMNLGGVESHPQHGLYVLAPRNWITVRAEVATDGSGDVVLAASKSAKSPRLTFGWAWNGISLSGIAEYFPKLRSWAIKQGGGDPNLFPVIRGLHTTAIGDDAVRYTIGNANHPSASGVAMESTSPQWLFASGTVSGYEPYVNLMESFMVHNSFESLRG